MKRFFTGFLIIIFMFSNLTSAFADEKPTITSEAGILIDYDSGKILYEKNIYQKMYPASTTKIMTALLTLERTKLSDRVVINQDLGNIDGNSMFLKKGEIFTVEELLKVLLIRSANDAAVALANHISGSTENFANLMNKRAKELGAKNTHFTNPNGLPDPNHYTTAYDLALIAKETMKYEKFRQIVKTQSIEVPPTLETPQKRTFKNSNRFLWGVGGRHTMEYRGENVNIKYDLVDGIKTGFTTAARQCLVSSGTINNFRLICVILKCEGKDIYINSRTLLDYGFENYHLENIVKKGEVLGTKNIKSSKKNTLKFASTMDFNVLVKNGDKVNNINKKFIFNRNLNSNIKKGDIIGKVEFYENNKRISKISLMALNTISPKLIQTPNHENKSENKSTTIYYIFAEILVSFLLLFFIFRIKKNNKRKKRISKKV